MVFASLAMLPTLTCQYFSLFCVAYGIIRDDLNFFQSQLRINIECSFGLRVHRFGMLSKEFQIGVLVSKTNSDLCKPLEEGGPCHHQYFLHVPRSIRMSLLHLHNRCLWSCIEFGTDNSTKCNVDVSLSTVYKTLSNFCMT